MIQSEMKQCAKDNLKGRWGNAILFTAFYMILLWAANYLLAWIPYAGPVIFFIFAIVMSYNMLICFIHFKKGNNITPSDIIVKIPRNLMPACKIAGNIILKLLPYIVICVILYIIIMMAKNSYSGEKSLWDLSVFDDGAITITISIIILSFVALIPVIMAVKKGLLYAFAYIIFYDSDVLSERDSLEKSRYMMYDNRMSFFIFVLRFSGWILLEILICFAIYKLLYLPFMVFPVFLQSFLLFIPAVAGAFWLLPYMQISIIIYYEKLLEKKENEDRKRG